MSDDKDGYYEALLHIDIWLSAVLLQRKRVVESMGEDLKADAQDQPPQVEHVLARQGDANMLVFALHQLRLTVSLIHRIADGKEKEDISESVSVFDSLCPQIKRMRDVLAHFDEYATGEGRMQKKKERTCFNLSAETKINWSNGEQGLSEYSIEVDISPGVDPIRVEVNASAEAAFELAEETKKKCWQLNARKANA